MSEEQTRRRADPIEGGERSMPRGNYAPVVVCSDPYTHEADRGVDLDDLVRALVGEKTRIAIITAAVGIVAVAVAFLMTPVYVGETVFMPAGQEEARAGLSGIAGQLGNLAPLAGVTLGGGTGRNEAIATLRSRALTTEFMEEENLLPILYDDLWDANLKTWAVSDPEDVPTLWEAYEYFDEDIRTIKLDDETGTIALQIEWKNADQAAQWANDLVRRTNERLRRTAIEEAQKNIEYLQRELEQSSAIELQQAIYGLIESQLKTIMVAKTRDEYAVKVIDPAVAPEKPAKPKKALIIGLGLVLGFFAGTVGTFLRVSRKGTQGARVDRAGLTANREVGEDAEPRSEREKPRAGEQESRDPSRGAQDA